MSGIIEIWRKEAGPNLPIRFTVGNRPILPNGSEIEDSPVVRKIDYRESGAIAGKRLSEPVFCISFEDSFVQRFVPAAQVIDVAYETKKGDEVKTPSLEE